MGDQNLVRGVFVAAIALFFGMNALRLHVGELARTGPGLFPLIVSSLLLLLALLMIVQSNYAEARRMNFDLKNIGVITLGLCSFVVASHVVSIMLGVVLLVFIAGLAARTYSWKRNAKISIGLILVAVAFQKLLGLNLGIV